MGLEALLQKLSPGGRDFERLCMWLLENVPEYRSQLNQVWLWNEWPGGWGRDLGIDLVAEDHDGGLWAIQAKHYDPAYAIKKADLDSFLSASSRSEFTFRLLIATTDHLGPNAKRTLEGQEKPVAWKLRSELEAMEVRWPTSITRLRPAKPKRKKPRPYQRQAIRDCVQGLAAADRGQLVMACGTGKTLVGPFLAEQMAAKRVLVLVPSLSLLAQTLREWATAFEFDYLAVCSDETVTKDEQDAVVASTSELGIPVTTDSQRIARFLRRRGGEMKVVFSTYQSSAQIAAAQANHAPAFDLVIADGAHRCAGPEAGVFATVIDARKIKARKRLFMTATPRYFTGRVKQEAKEADWEVASMDEEAKFGTVFHRLTFAQAIGQELLSDYQVVVVGVSDGEARDLAERGAVVSTDGSTVTDARTLAREIGLLRSMANYDLHRVVTFHSRIDHASRFASSLPETNRSLARRRLMGTLWTEHVSGKMTAGERGARLRRLEAVEGDQRGVLTNARCLTEGVDIPTLDGVAFIDPRRSQIDVVQAVGRAIRKAEKKNLGTIVIPVLVDEDSDPEAALEASEFDRVWQVVRALRNHDELLAEEIDELRRELGHRGSIGKRPRKIVLDLPVGIGNAFRSAFDTRLVERASSDWELGMGAALAFYEHYGNLRVLHDHVSPTGVLLGDWITNRRRDKRLRRLSAERIAALDALGMVWDPKRADWDSWIAAASAYRTEHGDLRVPYEKQGLGNWISIQRTNRKRGTLREEQIAELDAVGMVWDPMEVDWQEGIVAAYAYRRAHSDLRVPHDFVTNHGFRLGDWIMNRRKDRRRVMLASERIAELDALGMVWNPKQEDWDAWIAAASAYRAGHGDLRVPHAKVGLGNWIIIQRWNRKQGRLSAERIAELDALGMVWDARKKTDG